MRHAVQTPLSEQDYLEGERANPVRHEYVAGGTSDYHPDTVLACDGTRLTLKLDEFYEDTGLLVV